MNIFFLMEIPKKKMLSEPFKWNIVQEYFDEKGFVSHQIDTFNEYINHDIERVINECDINTENYSVKFSEVHIPNPCVIDEDRSVRTLLPSEARQRDLTYDSPIFVNVTEIFEEEGKEKEIIVHKRIIIGRTPVMLLSSKCNLLSLSKTERIKSGECEYDHGGYFLIKGKERVLIGQIRGIYNQCMVYQQKEKDKFKFVCEIRSMSEETGHSVLIQAKLGIDDRTIVFSIPYIKELIPVGILFKALGFTKEDDIRRIIGNTTNNRDISRYIKYIIRDSYHVLTQEDALRWLSQFTLHVIKDDKKIDYTSQVIENELFPHMGIFATIKEKALFLGQMIYKLFQTSLGLRAEDDRDNYANKRVEMAGVLCGELFRTLFKRFNKTIKMQIEKKKQRPAILSIISRTNSITTGLRSCFSTGSWAVQKNAYARQGVSQVLSRLTYGATLSHMRRIQIPLGREGKNAKIRQIHPSQIGFICCVETPEGQSVGIVMNLSLMTTVTKRIPTSVVKEIIENSRYLININHTSNMEDVENKIKVFVNGILMGVTIEPQELLNEIKQFRKNGLLHPEVSIMYDDVDEEIRMFCDEGRLIRPVFVLDDKGKLVIDEKEFIDKKLSIEKLRQHYFMNLNEYELYKEKHPNAKFPSPFVKIIVTKGKKRILKKLLIGIN